MKPKFQLLTKADLMVRWNRSERTVRRWIKWQHLTTMVFHGHAGGNSANAYHPDDVASCEQKLRRRGKLRA